MSSPDNGSLAPDAGLPRRPIIIALVLSILLTIGVLIGTKLVFGDGRAPISLTTVPGDASGSPECARLIERLPDRLGGMKRARLADPVPAGAAAWSKNRTEKITLRCGVNPPSQYTRLSHTQTVDGYAWLPVTDMTKGSNLRTWYLVNQSPLVAVTVDTSDPASNTPPEGLINALVMLNNKPVQPHPAPLVKAAIASGSATSCEKYVAALPQEFTANDVHYTRLPQQKLKQAGYTTEVAGYRADTVGVEPIITRCGLALPASYRPGVHLEQVNEIPWYLDTAEGSGSTQGVWYALGRDVVIGVSMPQEVSATTALMFSKVISEHTQKTG